MMRLYLIRHGQTDWNLAHKIQGSKDIPLNETGREQARLMAAGMKERTIDRVYTSPLSRAMETAEALAESQQVPLFTVTGLEEINYGKWEGMSLPEIEAAYRSEYQAWLKDSVNVAAPGGETQLQVLERTAAAMNAILQDMVDADCKAAAVVSHGAALCCIFAWLLREDSPVENGYQITNAAITTIEFDPETGKSRLIELNDTRHFD